MNDPLDYSNVGEDFVMDEEERSRRLSNEQIEEINLRQAAAQEQNEAIQQESIQPATAVQPEPQKMEPQPTGEEPKKEEGFLQGLSYFGQPLGETNEQVKQRLSAPGQGFIDFVTEAINSRLPDNFQIPKATKYEDSVAQATRNISSWNCL